MRCHNKLALVTIVFFFSTVSCKAQETPTDTRKPKDASFPALLVGSFNPVRFAHNVSSDTFWLIGGGSAEVSSPAFKHVSAVANVYGGRASYRTAGANGLNLVTYTFGPRYTFSTRSGKYSFFGEGLVGEARGSDVAYPEKADSTSQTYLTIGSTSARSLAFLTGAGMDLKVTKHFAWRALEVDYLRTQLPVAHGSPQDNLRVGTGIVFRLDYRHAR